MVRGRCTGKRYELDHQDTADTSGNYTKDWYLKQVTNIDQPTTSTDTILAANALNYHTWRTENDKLLQRMGELRHNGEEARGPGSGCGEQKSVVTENLILKTSILLTSWVTIP